MIFCDFLGPDDIYDGLRHRLRKEMAAVFRSPESAIALRRIVTQDDRREVELWVELSSEEQIYRAGSDLAERISAVVRESHDVDVWVMFRVVPLAHAFLNGSPRGRGSRSFE